MNIFIYSKKSGHGTLYLSFNRRWQYKGEFKNGFFNGRGKLLYKNENFEKVITEAKWQ